MLNLAELEKIYADMSDEEFARLYREDLVVAARPYYDREARRRGLPEPQLDDQPPVVLPHSILAEARERLTNSAKADLRRFKRLSTEMGEQDIAQVYPPIPDPVQIQGQAEARRAARKRQLEMLANLPRSGQGPWRIAFTYKTMVVPAEDRGDKLIVWLRRFHVKRPKGLPFSDLLVPACQGLGLPLTVQDRSFRSSDAEVMPRFAPLLFLSSCWLTVMLYLKPVSDVGVDLLIASVVTNLALIPLLWFLGGRVGYHDLKPATATEQVLHLIHQIKQRSGRHGDDSVLIVRCQDSFWRGVVQTCLTHASAVVIDVTEVSENVIWELKTALQTMAPESILLVHGLGNGDRAGLPQQISEVLVSELGADGANRVQHFFYPKLTEQVDRGQLGTRESLEDELQARLAVAVAYSEYRRGFLSSECNHRRVV